MSKMKVKGDLVTRYKVDIKGICRLCVVEIDALQLKKRPALNFSCSYQSYLRLDVLGFGLGRVRDVGQLV